MKRTLSTFLCLAAFVLSGTKSYGQQSNTLSVVYGTGGDGLFFGGIGAAGYASKGFTIAGLNYVRHFKGVFSIETGLEYGKSKLLLNYVDPPRPDFKPLPTSIQMLTLPVYGRFTFFRYAFLNAGLSVNLETDQTAQRITPDESGIGIFLGVGGKYTFGRITLSANPFFQLQSVVPFSSNGGRALVNNGFKFGLGYNF
ncbi:MAG: hypothetical protein JSU01_13995 [Bacteroidetes bacterium]|nr:hypothetical protein [Bacteroidota bacterium]